MPRIPRAVAIGFPHHITQRGNYRQPVFEHEEDHQKYLNWVQSYSEKYRLKIWAYCLMSNHVHFVAVPMETDSLARTFNTLHMRYAQYVNRKHGTPGHLWQGRFFSCVLDERHLYAGMRYVENNPVRAGIVQKATDYPWSSARCHALKQADPVISNDCYLLESINDWEKYLKDQEEPAVLEAIRDNTRTGRPCGNEGFKRKMEVLLSRRLTALAWGRPRQTKE